jgi:hypothetical protein
MEDQGGDGMIDGLLGGLTHIPFIHSSLEISKIQHTQLLGPSSTIDLIQQSYKEGSDS